LQIELEEPVRTLDISLREEHVVLVRGADMRDVPIVAYDLNGRRNAQSRQRAIGHCRRVHSKRDVPRVDRYDHDDQRDQR
jgi:ribosomal protein S12